jgi:D-beta-D-heptose 7-phosphate kinase / D-beta-D-heptose 1-phosphate adenosyltransferase
MPVSADVARQLRDAFSAAVEQADLVVLSDYAKGVLCDSVMRAAIDTARRCGKMVIVDPKSKEFASTCCTPAIFSSWTKPAAPPIGWSWD